MPTDTWIETSSSTLVDLLDPQPDMIRLDDIAHALSQICRYGGHAMFPYSVAQHSVLTASLVPFAMGLEALMHDAAEAYIGDMVRPLKVNAEVPGYLHAEQRVEAAIRERFGLGRLDSEAIKYADLQMLAAEKRVLVPNSTRRWACLEGVEPARVRIRDRRPGQDRVQFLEAFRRYGADRIELRGLA